MSKNIDSFKRSFRQINDGTGPIADSEHPLWLRLWSNHLKGIIFLSLIITAYQKCDFVFNLID